jgi:hypothetical protein
MPEVNTHSPPTFSSFSDSIYTTSIRPRSQQVLDQVKAGGVEDLAGLRRMHEDDLVRLGVPPRRRARLLEQLAALHPASHSEL